MSIAQTLNTRTEPQAREALTNCCASQAWVEAMLAARPFADDEAVEEAAEAAAAKLGEPDWLEAFAAHPLIGDVKSLRTKYAATKALAAGEQSGVAAASDATLQELATLNQEYRDRFGFIFIVFATGKTAEEMLAILEDRINNPRQRELLNAAGEQMKITKLRLQKLASRPGDA
jgi:2-oxo-4-hydroxy-4-carboxy-5-ureidoimidazoline decarboxylase